MASLAMLAPDLGATPSGFQVIMSAVCRRSEGPPKAKGGSSVDMAGDSRLIAEELAVVIGRLHARTDALDDEFGAAGVAGSRLTTRQA